MQRQQRSHTTPPTTKATHTQAHQSSVLMQQIRGRPSSQAKVILKLLVRGKTRHSGAAHARENLETITPCRQAAQSDLVYTCREVIKSYSVLILFTAAMLFDVVERKHQRQAKNCDRRYND